MTLKEAKTLSLEVWRYFAEHPEIEFKKHLPEDMYSKIVPCRHLCPLCDLFNYVDTVSWQEKCREGCPLNIPHGGCFAPKSFYQHWSKAMSDEARQKYAQKIVDAIEAWEEK